MRLSILYLFVLCIASLILSCQRDDNLEIDSEVILDPSTGMVEGNLGGQVIDKEGFPIENAIVKFEDHTTETDTEGFFFIDSDVVYEHATSIEVYKENYFRNYKTLNAIAGQTTYTKVTLVEKTDPREFTSATGNRYILNDAYIDLPSGSYTDNENNALLADAIFSGYWISPELSNTRKIPGNMSGIDKNGMLVAITNYGVMVSELSDANGDTYNLPEGKIATLSFPVTSRFSGIAPETISLWHFDTKNRVWLEKGDAQKENDSYIANVSQLGYWAVGTDHSGIILSGVLSSQVAPRNVDVIFHLDDIGYSSALDVSEDGNYSILIPASETFRIEVISNLCNYQSTLALYGPYEMDANLNIDVSVSDRNVMGIVNDCSGNPVQKGAVRFGRHNTNYFIPIVNGRFDLGELSCSDDRIELMAIDFNRGAISTPISKSLKEIDNEILSTCTEFDMTSSIDYNNLDWDQLSTEVEHNWKISRITGNINRIIVSPTITHTPSGAIVMTGDFVFNSGDDMAKYKLTYHQDGFSVAGTCSLKQLDHNGTFTSFKFTGVTENIKILDAGLYPTNGVGNVHFDLTYFD